MAQYGMFTLDQNISIVLAYVPLSQLSTILKNFVTVCKDLNW